MPANLRWHPRNTDVWSRFSVNFNYNSPSLIRHTLSNGRAVLSLKSGRIQRSVVLKRSLFIRSLLIVSSCSRWPRNTQNLAMEII